jgi:serine/threonine-protein kinase HipA
MFKDGYWSDSRILSSSHHPCKDDFIEFGKRIGLKDARIDKLLQPFLEKQSGVDGLLARSFLDEETQALYLAHYNERLEMLAVNQGF